MPAPELELVVIGGSAGSLRPLEVILASLPDDRIPAVVIVVHMRGQRDSYLSQILSRHTDRPVVFASNNATIEDGHIYLAPPDLHVLVSRGRLRLSSGPRENGFRPAVDPLFRSAARAYGAGVMGIVLSGALDDGTYGLKLIKEAGGVTVVQDPEEAEVPAMPKSAVLYVDVDHVLRAGDIPKLLEAPAVPQKGASVMARKREPEPQQGEPTNIETVSDLLGPPSGLTCPDCGGALWEIEEGTLAHYRCHVGHQFTTDGLDTEQQDAVENALWTAVRVLEEHADLRRRMAARAGSAGMTVVSSGFEQGARDSEQQAHTIRELLFRRVRPAEGAATLNVDTGNGKGAKRNRSPGGKTRRQPR